MIAEYWRYFLGEIWLYSFIGCILYCLTSIVIDAFDETELSTYLLFEIRNFLYYNNTIILLAQ